MSLEQNGIEGRPSPLRRAVWRWHFYAGLFAAPVLLVLAITGALYLFQREIDHWWNRDIDHAAVGAAQHPLFHQEEMVLASFPGAVLRSVRLPDAPDRATKWLVTLPGGGDREIYLDQYAGKINGVRDPAWQPMTIARKLHGTLLAGDAGSYVVELVACWTLVMLLTGMYLWWPQRWQIGGVIAPRLTASGRRFWRDLHAVPSIFNALLVAFLILTGLPWSAFWGVQFSRIGEIVPLVAPSPNFSAHLSHTVTAVAGDGQAKVAHDHNHGTAQLPWVIQNTPSPTGNGAAASSIVAAEQHLELLGTAKWGSGTTIFYPRDPSGVFMVSYVPAKAEGQRTLYVNPGDGKILRNVGWSDYSAAGKVTEWGVLTHMGRQYGLANQIAGLLVCLGIVGGVTAGIVLWWRRRPSCTLGAPPHEAQERLPPMVFWGIAALAVLFPLVGASLILLWAARKARTVLLPAT